MWHTPHAWTCDHGLAGPGIGDDDRLDRHRRALRPRHDSTNLLCHCNLRVSGPWAEPVRRLLAAPAAPTLAVGRNARSVQQLTSGPTASMMSSSVGLAINSSSECRMAARCTGDVPQHPPTMLAPAFTASCVYLPISSGVPVYTASVPAKYGTPQLPLEIRWVWTSRSVIASSETRMSLAPTPQLAPIANGGSASPSNTCDRSPGKQAHHRATGGVERAGRGVLQPGLECTGRGSTDLLGCRHGLDPGDVGATCLQALGQLAERFDRGALGESPERFEELAGGSHRPGHDDRARTRVGDLTGDLGGSLGQLVHTTLGTDAA